MKKQLLFGLLVASMLIGCDKENGTDLPDPEPIPELDEPQDNSTFLKFSTCIKLMDEVMTKASVSQFHKDNKIGNILKHQMV